VVVHLLAHDQRIARGAARPAGRFGEGRPQQAERAGLAMQFTRQAALAFPVVLVRQHLAGHEGADGLAQGGGLGAVPGVGHGGHGADSSMSMASAAYSAAGMSMRRERSHSARPLACGSKRAWEATPAPSRPSMTKLTARRFGSAVRVIASSAVSGSSSRSRSTV